MDSIFRKSICVFLASLLATFQVQAQTKPTLIISPLKGKNAKAALDAIRLELEKSNRMFLLEGAKISEYVGEKNGKEKKVDSKKASEAFEAGKKAYENLQIGQAITSLEKSKKLYLESLSDERSFEGLRTTQFHLAMAYYAQNDAGKAAQELKEMILLDPNRDETKPSEKYYSPKIRELYQKVLKDVQALEKAQIHVQTTPPGATIFLDGERQGVTPFDLEEIPVGKHYIRLVSPTGLDEMIEKVLLRGSNDVDFQFPAASSTDPYLFFQTVPPGKDLGQERASYLDEMGLTLGADVFLFLTPLEGKVRAQFYDQRSQELSKEVTESNPQALVDKLLTTLGNDGYVIARGIEDSDSTEEESVGVQLKPRPGGAPSSDAIPYTPTPENQKSDSKAWYQNHWVWVGIGGALLLAGGAGLYFGLAGSNSSNSTIKATIP